ncbi:MAG: serine protease [Lachnospiraceae bacterium]|nr:serine protease [Lachnospiraceae bacterium]
MDGNNSSEYQFIKETIKERPVNKKKILMRIIMVVICALIFGAVSAAVFLMTVRHYMPQDTGSTETHVNIPRDEDVEPVSVDEAESEESTENGSTEEAEQVTEASTEAVAVSDNDSGKDPSADNGEGEDGEDREKVTVSYITEHVSLSVEDYKSLYRTLRNVAAEAGKSIVTVNAVTSDTDWFENPYENTHSLSGLVVANNGKDLLILSEMPEVGEDTEYNVTFPDNVTLPGAVKSVDGDTGLAIISVLLESIPDRTKAAIKEAELGNSRGTNVVGIPVMALGSPLGVQGSQCFGRSTSNQREISMPDRNVHVLSTDIYGSENATGVIIDYDGRVLGIIAQSTAMEETPNLLSAYAISDLKDLIEKLSNGSSETYLGIFGTDVTDAINEKEGVPFGFYVTKVELDSPAMAAGIQSGDVITRLGTADIENARDYMEQMLKYQPGDEAVITVERYSQGEYQEMTFEVNFDDAADHAG